jgi:hypothetical protein
MSEKEEGNNGEKPLDVNREKYLEAKKERESHKEEIITEDISGPSFMPTFQVKAKFFPLPIITVVVLAGILAYITYVIAGFQIEGVPFSESEGGAGAALLNGLIFIIYAAVASFVMIFLMKKLGVGVLKFIFALSFWFLCFSLLWIFGDIIVYLLSPTYEFYVISTYVLLGGVVVFSSFLVYKYLKGDSQRFKNLFILLVGLLIGAFMGIVIPPITTIIILILMAIWDIFAVKSKRGPIKEMMEIIFEQNPEKEKKKRIEKLTENGEYEVEYDISSLEIGIGDLAFYSMLTSYALIFTNNIVIMIATAIAVIMGTGITILGLRRNRILPGLPISIFLGLGTMYILYLIDLVI